jgi:hypothetical protein
MGAPGMRKSYDYNLAAGAGALKASIHIRVIDAR